MEEARSALARGDLQNAWNCANQARQEAGFDPQPLLLLAEILLAAGRHQEARGALSEAIMFGADPAMAAILEAEVDLREHAFESARDRLAALTDQNDARVQRGLASAHFGLGDYETAAECSMKAGAPSEAEMLRVLILSLKACGRSEEALEALRMFQKNSTDPDSTEWLGVLPHLYAPMPAQKVFESHVRFARFGSRGIARVRENFPNARDPNRPLHIGYFQPEYWGRWMPRFIHPWLVAHDLSRFRITLYASGDPRMDEPTRDAFSSMNYRNLAALDDDSAARAIADDEVDILVDLAGLTSTGRPGMLARKPAPIIVTYLGYPATTGLEAVDYRFVDAITDPPGAERFATEQLWRLDPCFLCFRFPDWVPQPSPPPSLTAGHVTFGSFNVLDKTGPHVSFLS